jgi:hypothetical protein
MSFTDISETALIISSLVRDMTSFLICWGRTPLNR